jgi:Flp pilus assembly secretin CpaC
MRSALTVAIILLLLIVGVPLAAADEMITIQVNHGLLVKLRNAERVVVAAPDIADVSLITRNELMIIAKRAGETTVSVWDARGYTTYRIMVILAPSPDIVKAITDALQEPAVQVKLVGETVVLEGKVKTEADKKRAEDIAKSFGKPVANALTVEQQAVPRTQVLEAQLRDALKDLPVVVKVVGDDTVLIEGTVANQTELIRLEAIAKAFVKNAVVLVRIREPLQFQVATFFAEINRTALRQMGVDWGGGNATDLLTDPYVFHFGNLNQAFPLTPLQLLVARLQLLESKGLARTLSNPRLVVLEGQNAKLHVGGELPIPVVSALGGVTIAFKEFGIKLEFKAVGGTGPLTVDFKAEASALDFANAITAAGFRIPTIRTRRVESIVSLRPGEFLITGGLIQREESRNVQQIPILGDIPILGALFRSQQFTRGETELVIFISPSIVAPTRERPQEPQPETTSP